MPTTRLSDPITVLVIAPDPAPVEAGLRRAAVKALQHAASVAAALEDACAGDGPDVVLMHIPVDGIAAVVEQLTHAFPRAALVHVLDAGSDREREQATRAGVDDVLCLAELDAAVGARRLRQALVRRRYGLGNRARGELRYIFDLNPHPMWVQNRVSGRILAVNRAALDTYGYSEAEFLQRTASDLAGDTAPDAAGRACAGGLQRHRRKDGRHLDVEITIQPLPLYDPAACLVQARDVTVERTVLRNLEASERRYRNLFQHSTAFVCIHDLDGVLLSANDATLRALGYGRAGLLGTSMRSLVPLELQPAFDEYLRTIVEKGEASGFINLLRADGKELLWRYSNRVFEDADGVPCVVGMAEDVTRVRAMEAELQASTRRLRIIAEILPVQVATLDHHGRVTFANESFRKAHRAEGGSVIGRSIGELIGIRRMRRWMPELERVMAGKRAVFQEGEGEAQPGEGPWQEVICIPEQDTADGAVVAVHLMLRDITDQKQEELRLLRLAHVDSLTGLLNRGGFHERLERALSRSRDQQLPLALFYVDMDRFKQVNDNHGHPVGDALLRDFSARLLDTVRLSDVVARLGGDEFVVLMEGVGPEAAAAVAGKLVAALGRPFELHAENLVLGVGATVGVAAGSALHLEGSEFIARADEMLYAAKQAGRGTWRMVELDVEGRPLAGTGASGEGAGG